jgi:hypothetical protein
MCFNITTKSYNKTDNTSKSKDARSESTDNLQNFETHSTCYCECCHKKERALDVASTSSTNANMTIQSYKEISLDDS